MRIRTPNERKSEHELCEFEHTAYTYSTHSWSSKSHANRPQCEQNEYLKNVRKIFLQNETKISKHTHYTRTDHVQKCASESTNRMSTYGKKNEQLNEHQARINRFRNTRSQLNIYDAYILMNMIV